ncbi:MAG: regulatory protein RecX [Flavobacteriaceae bacterium]
MRKTDLVPMHQEDVSEAFSKALKKMEHYCAYQERCPKEVLGKLGSTQLTQEAIDHIMVHLTREGYLDEARFAKSYVLGKFRIKKWGKKRLVNELRQRDIATYHIKAALREIPEKDYLETFGEQAQKRWDSLREPVWAKKKRKFITFLLYRGWENDLVHGKWNELRDTHNSSKG